jgi:hypothetical protein
MPKFLLRELHAGKCRDFHGSGRAGLGRFLCKKGGQRSSISDEVLVSWLYITILKLDEGGRNIQRELTVAETEVVEPEFRQMLPKGESQSYYCIQTGDETKFRANWRTEGQDEGKFSDDALSVSLRQSYVANYDKYVLPASSLPENLTSSRPFCFKQGRKSCVVLRRDM